MTKPHAGATRQSYADAVIHAIQTGDNPSGKKMSIRELGRRVELSYEQVRKICLGFPVVSEESNGRLCRILGLDAEVMWKRALEEKFSRRYTVEELPDQVPVTISGRMGVLWPQLGTELQEKVYRYAELMFEEYEVQQRRVKRALSKR